MFKLTSLVTVGNAIDILRARYQYCNMHLAQAITVFFKHIYTKPALTIHTHREGERGEKERVAHGAGVEFQTNLIN